MTAGPPTRWSWPGVACFLNPEPLAPFIDLFMLGEAEEMLPAFFGAFDPAVPRRELLLRLARSQAGLYVPAFYRPNYHSDGTLQAFTPVVDVPPRIRRVFLPDLSKTATCSAVVTPHTTFERTYLIETGRGCPHGCRFCSAGYIYRPPRFRPLALLEENLRQGSAVTDRIGLVGAAVSDLPEIGALCSGLRGAEVRISFSSLRADALTPELIATLQRRESGYRHHPTDPRAERHAAVHQQGHRPTSHGSWPRPRGNAGGGRNPQSQALLHGGAAHRDGGGRGRHRGAVQTDQAPFSDVQPSPRAYRRVDGEPQQLRAQTGDTLPMGRHG
ncbi:MAG: hypothetical protein U5J82_11845 [Desulfobacterales bacterium]|nr:hypothetical protein [Desulfobacterales bacterium]